MLAKPKSPYLPFGDQQTAPWYGKDILSVKQFSRADLEYTYEVAHEMRTMVERIGTFDLLKGKILANLFYEPSTRTASSCRPPPCCPSPQESRVSHYFRGKVVSDPTSGQRSMGRLRPLAFATSIACG